LSYIILAKKLSSIKNKMSRGFTLLELLLVVAIIAVLSTFVIVAVNPMELMKRSRDSVRLNDLNTLKQAILTAANYKEDLDMDGPNFSGSCSGQSSPKVFVSVPFDNGETPPPLPLGWAGWSWSQVSTDNLYNMDGTGWLPVDFRSSSGTPPSSTLAALSVDPINTFASGFYFTYVCGGSFELTAKLESKKYEDDKVVLKDGGDSLKLYETGSDLEISYPRPLQYPPEIIISSISPINGANDNIVNITLISGDNFTAGAIVKLTKAGQTDIIGSGFDVINPTTITGGSFNINGAVLGGWNLMVINIDGGSGILADGFTVMPPPPVISSITPNNFGQGAINQAITINGVNFTDPEIISFNDAGITADSIMFIDSTQLTASVTISGSTPVGSKNITVTSGSGQSYTCVGCFTVNIAPTAISANPVSGAEGTAALDVEITGSGFANGATASFSGSGIAVNTVTFNSGTSLTANIDISGSAAVGARDIIVTNPDGGIGTGMGLFAVTLPTPTVSSSSPNNLGQGAVSQMITIDGTNFTNPVTVSFSGTGIAVNSTNFVNAAQLTASVTISGTAATGLRDVTVINNGDSQQGVCTGCFAVNPKPTITSLAPTSAMQGAANLNVTVNGTNFITGANASFSGTGIVVNSTTFVNATRLTANITISGSAPIGARDIIITNGDQGVGTRTTAFTVTAAPLTITKTFTLDGSLENYLATCTTVVCTRDTTDGNPGTGDIQERLTVQNSSRPWQWELSGITWEDLGVPAGATVNNVNGSYSHRVASAVNFNTGGSNNSGTLTIRDGATGATTYATLESALSYTSATTTAWAIRNATGAVTPAVAGRPSNASIRIRLAGNIRTTNVANPNVILRQDQITLVIAYTLAPVNLTKTFTLDASLENYLATCTTVVCARDTTDGNPGTGDIQETHTTRNSSRPWQWELSGITWEDLGVPAGATVNNVNGSYSHRVASAVNMNTTAGNNTSGALTIRDGALGTTTVATLESALSYTSATATSWAVRNATGAVTPGVAYRASSTPIRIRLAGNIRTTNVANPNVILRQDQITLVINYTPGQ
jgi:prepilin-type N-terminal cleavage/methylation domain-containing protein